MDKHDIRRTVRARKSLMSDTERSNAAAEAFRRIEHLASFMMANRILMYHSLPDELDTRNFLDRWSDRKQFFLPRVNGINLDLLPYIATNLSSGSYDIQEPLGDDVHPIEEMELVIVPAMAYDRNGNRVGRGKGFYDRMLADTGVIKIGVAYDCQLFDSIETDPGDIPVDIVVTESHTIIIRH